MMVITFASGCLVKQGIHLLHLDNWASPVPTSTCKSCSIPLITCMHNLLCAGLTTPPAGKHPVKARQLGGPLPLHSPRLQVLAPPGSHSNATQPALCIRRTAATPAGKAHWHSIPARPTAASCMANAAAAAAAPPAAAAAAAQHAAAGVSRQ
jgi:hypothetical protein